MRSKILFFSVSSKFKKPLKISVFGLCPIATKNPVAGISCFLLVLLLKTLTPVTT